MIQPNEEAIDRAARVLDRADALLIAAGAGMGVDSGLPDFRGPEGFWRAYPAYARLGLRFEEMADPGHFETDPALGWGFYGHRTNLYRATQPHDGFAILRRWADRMPRGGFVFTSNVDGHFQRSGFAEEQVVECHGSIHWWQCMAGCRGGIFPAEPGEIPVDPETFRAIAPFPSCPRCGGLARPNIMMFGDWNWDATRSRDQNARLEGWIHRLRLPRVAVIELGAGRAIPTVRRFCEGFAGSIDLPLIRINLRESEGPGKTIGLAMGALEALRAIDARRSGSGRDQLDQG